MKTTTMAGAFVLLLLFACNTPNKTDWNKWRGPYANGISMEKNWSAELDSTHILWKKNIGKGHTSIATKGDRCYVSGWERSIEGEDTVDQSTLYCLDNSTGESIWTFVYPASQRSFPGPRSTPVIDGNNLYALGWEGLLMCLNAVSGEIVWERDVYSDSLARRDTWGYCPSPVIYKNLLLLNLNTSGMALDKTNGEVVWNSEKGTGGFSSTTLFKRDGKMLGTFTSDSTLYLVDVMSGDVVMKYMSDSHFRRDNDVMLTNDPNQLFLSNELLKMNGDTLVSVWRNDTVASYFRTGVVMGDYAYQFNNYKNKMKLICVDLKTGEPKWQHQYGMWGSVMGLDDKLVVLTGLGKVVTVEATPEAYRPISELQVLPAENNRKNWCWTMPSFSNGHIYIRNSNGDMGCIGLKAKL